MIEINLLPEELKTKSKKAGIGINIETKYRFLSFPLVLGILICIHIYLGMLVLTKNSQMHALNKKWISLEQQRKIFDDFSKANAILSEDASLIKSLSQQRIIWSEKLRKLSLGLPSGIWFNEISMNPRDLNLNASVVSLQKEEMSLIKKFIDNLKNDANFFKDFNNLELNSGQIKTIGSYDVLNFVLVGTLRSNEKPAK